MPWCIARGVIDVRRLPAGARDVTRSCPFYPASQANTTTALGDLHAYIDR